MDIEQAQGDAGKAAMASPVGTAISTRGLARRNFTKAGIGASGVLLTLVSQPGMASSICRSPSGSLSGGLESRVPVTNCLGKIPGYYASNSGANFPAGVLIDVKFGDVFACTGTNSATFGDKSTTLLSILTEQSFDSAHLGMFMSATYLNIMAGRIGFLTVNQLQAIWSDWQSKGYYEPTAGTNWYASDIVTYLSGTGS